MLELPLLTSRVSTASSSVIQQEKHLLTSRRCVGDTRKIKRLIAIDPGLQGTGIAEWDDHELVGVWVLDVESRFGKLEWPDRADLIAHRLVKLLCPPAHDTAVVCEMPEFQGGAGRSMGWKTGDLQRLAYLVGLFGGRVHPSPFYPVLVHEWKGQLPKKVVEDRLTKILGANVCQSLGIKSHAWDAVGIGMWAQGKF